MAWARETLELSPQEVGSAIGASERTISRWLAEDNHPSGSHVQAAERLLELAFVLDKAFGRDMHRLHAWLHEPLPVFKGRTPLRTILNGSVEDVITVVANIEGGVFA